MPHLDEGTIHAWLDNALPSDEAAAVAEHVASCEACAAQVAEARGVIAAASRILQALDNVPSGVVPSGVSPAGGGADPVDKVVPLLPRRAAWYRRPSVRAAAGIVVVAAGSLWATRAWREVPHVAPVADVGDRVKNAASASAASKVASKMASTESSAATMAAPAAPSGGAAPGAASARAPEPVAANAVRASKMVAAESAVATNRMLTSSAMANDASVRAKHAPDSPAVMRSRLASPMMANVAQDGARQAVAGAVPAAIGAPRPQPADSVARETVASAAESSPSRAADVAPQAFAKAATKRSMGLSGVVVNAADSRPTVVRHLTCDSVDVTEYMLRDRSHVLLFERDSAVDVARVQSCLALKDSAAAVSAQHAKGVVASTSALADSTTAGRDVRAKSSRVETLPWAVASTRRHYVLIGAVPIQTLIAVRQLLGLPQ